MKENKSKTLSVSVKVNNETKLFNLKILVNETNKMYYGYFYYYNHEKHKSTPKWLSTGLNEKGNLTKATEICIQKLKDFIMEYESKLQVASKELFEYTLKEYAERYLSIKSEKNRSNTKRGYKSNVNVLEKFFKNKKITEITQQDILNFYKHLRAKGRTENTISHYSKFLSPIFDLAIYEKVYKEKNPAKYNKFDKDTFKLQVVIPKKPITILEPEQQKKILEIIKNPPESFYKKLEMPWLSSLYLGVRRGELCALELADFDFEKNKVLISKSLDYNNENEAFINNTKSNEQREIFMPKQFANMIKDYVKSQDKSLWKENNKIFSIPYNLQDKKGIMEFNPIFRHEDGSLITPSYLSHTYNKLLKKCNFQPHTRWHDLRHTCASNLIDMGMDLYEVKQYLGHESIKTTERYYANIFAEKKKERAKLIGETLNSRFNID